MVGRVQASGAGASTEGPPFMPGSTLADRRNPLSMTELCKDVKL